MLEEGNNRFLASAEREAVGLRSERVSVNIGTSRSPKALEQTAESPPSLRTGQINSCSEGHLC